MPELPEVETIVRALQSGGRGQPAIPGRVIRSVELLWDRTLAQPGRGEFERRLPGQTVQSVSRRAKYLLLSLTQDTLLIHLRMSGDLRVEDDLLPVLKHDRLLIHFQDGMRLAFNDTRKFGRVWLTDDPQQILKGLGPEPFDPNLDAAEFQRMLQSTRRQIKPLLLDQSFLAGVGNIYSDEALHIAEIHPLTPADQISPEQSAKLLSAVRIVLEEGIRRNGASFDWVYRGGDFQNYFRVYQRTGEACPVCGTMVERKVIGQRSTHFCPVCQPAP